MIPRGVKNNNPGNIRYSKAVWEGLAAAQPDPDFVSFIDPMHGLRALMRNLLTHQRKYNLNSVQSLIGDPKLGWAPPSENDTGAYVRDVCMHVGVKPADFVDLEIPENLIRMAQAIAQQENGHCPDPTLPWWYPEETYEEAARLALA